MTLAVLFQNEHVITISEYERILKPGYDLSREEGMLEKSDDEYHCVCVKDDSWERNIVKNKKTELNTKNGSCSGEPMETYQKRR
jgi:hypothetical protein